MAGVSVNVIELKTEIQRLQLVKAEQEAIIKQQFESPKTTLVTLGKLLSDSRQKKGKEVENEDIYVRISKKLLPLTLKKTFFRNSNFIIKSLIGLASKKAAPHINKQNVSEIWNKLNSSVAK